MIHCYVWCGPRFLGSCFIYWLGSQNIIDFIALVLQGCIWGSSQGYHGLHRGGFGLHWLHRWQQVLNCVLDPLRNQWIIVTLPSAPCFKEVWWFSAVFQSSFHCFHSGRASLMPRLELLWTSTSSSSSPGTTMSGATATVSSTWSATCSRPSRASAWWCPLSFWSRTGLLLVYAENKCEWCPSDARIHAKLGHVLPFVFAISTFL